VVAKRPGDFGAMVALGVAHRGLGELDRARAVWDDVVRTAPRRSTVRGDALYDLAMQEKDFAAVVELQWFVTEQVEEEKTSTSIVETLRMIGDNASGLYMFDKELGSRGGAG